MTRKTPSTGFFPNETHHPNGNRQTRRARSSTGLSNNRKQTGNRKPRKSIIVAGKIHAFIQRISGRRVVHFITINNKKRTVKDGSSK